MLGILRAESTLLRFIRRSSLNARYHSLGTSNVLNRLLTVPIRLKIRSGVIYIGLARRATSISAVRTEQASQKVYMRSGVGREPRNTVPSCNTALRIETVSCNDVGFVKGSHPKASPFGFGCCNWYLIAGSEKRVSVSFSFFWSFTQAM